MLKSISIVQIMCKGHLLIAITNCMYEHNLITFRDKLVQKTVVNFLIIILGVLNVYTKCHMLNINITSKSKC